MHICIPDTREVRPQHGASYLLYNVHIDGLYHCSLRYKQLLHLHQALNKKFCSSSTSGLNHALPPFPPKKLLPLSVSRVEERRQQLEKYLQNISQDKTIANSTIFNMFLLEAQRESTRLVEPEKHVNLDIELVNGQKIRLPIVTHDSVDSVLTACCRALSLDDRYHAYFCLCLCGYDVVRDKLIIKRKLSFFEAPFITLQMAIQQQEQLQSVLSTETQPPTGASVEMTTATTTILDSNNNYHNQLTNYSPATTNSTNLKYGSNLNSCHCLSCSSQQQQQTHYKQVQTTTTTTGVPLVSSSNNGHTSYLDQQQSLAVSNNNHNYNQGCNRNGNQVWCNGRLQPTRRASNSPFVTHRILLRKSYWDPDYDSYILNDQQALNLLFIQTVYDMKHSLMFVDRETYHQLEMFLASDSKLEYILLARTLKYYNYVHFEPCYSDYPRPRTKVMISIGSKELNMRVLKTPRSIDNSTSANNGGGDTSHNSSSSYSNHHQQQTQQQQSQQQQEPVLYCTSSLVPSGYRHLITKEDLIEEEYNFKVPLIRCWRLTSLETLNSTNQQQHRATTTLAGGKRKSLSLFSSVVGNSISSTNNVPERTPGPSSASGAQTNQLHGYGGQSLMASLMASSGHSNQQRQQQPTRRPSTTSIGSNSFFNFRRNTNQSSNLSNGDSNTNNNHSCQENDHAQCLGHNHHRHLGPGDAGAEQTQLSQYELSFEYLIANDTLKWITISSDQAIFISISLQGVVDELVSKRDLGACLGDTSSLVRDVNSTIGTCNSQQQVSRPISIRQRQDSSDDDDHQVFDSFTYMYQDGGQKLIRSKSQQMLDKFCAGHSPPTQATNYSLAMARHRGDSFLSSSSQSRSSSSIFQVAGLWNSAGQDSGISSPGRRQFTRSTSNQNGSFSSPAGSFEISQFNSRKVPSPIINDAFEGVVTNDDDL